jgi:6-phosphogluconolactonase
MQKRRWHHYADINALVEERTASLLALASHCIAEQGRFTLVLSGGSTPAPLYRRLAGANTDWPRWHIWFSDERCLPVGHAERNDTMACECWLRLVPIPPEQIHTMPAELGAEAGATAYARQLRGLGNFDLVLLGVGEDGHTASLFPAAPAASGDAIAVFGAPKPPPQRISLSAARLSAADQVWFLVSGEQKREALTRWHQGEALPAALITPAAGVDIYTDVAPAQVARSDRPRNSL